MPRPIIATALVAALAARPAVAQPTMLYGSQALAAAEEAQELRDQAACTETGAKEGQGHDLFFAPTAGGIGGALLIGAVTGIANGLASIPRTENAIRRCMADAGYQPLTLSAEKTAELKALKSRTERTQWFARTPLFTPAKASPLHTVSTWDAEFNRPVTLVRDPVTGEMVKTFNVHP